MDTLITELSVIDAGTPPYVYQARPLEEERAARRALTFSPHVVVLVLGDGSVAPVGASCCKTKRGGYW